jgi:23S rRNA (uracil1939-C5)-methyltransferase
MFPEADLVEENKAAIALARENVRKKGTRYFAQSDRDWVRDAGRLSRGYGFIVVDPPRQGMTSQMTAWLGANGPPVLAYVSCEPATLCRDSAILLKSGYSLNRLILYDFYPQTANIETLALFNFACQ